MKKQFFWISTLIILSSSGLNMSFAAPGDLDTNFGTNGITTQDIDGMQNFGGISALQSDGKIVILSTAGDVGSRNYAVVRLNTDGSLDTNFGTNGISITDVTGGDDFPQALLALADDKILLIGGSDLSFVRFNADGSLDDSFGTNGVITMAPPIVSSRVTGAALQADGKILVTGDNDGDSAYVSRFLADGSIDSEFGENGSITLKVAGIATVTRGIAIQSNGSIIVIGLNNNGLFVKRLNSDGSEDSNFGDNSIIQPEFSTGVFASPQGIAVAHDDSLAIAATLSDESNPAEETIVLLVLRLNSDGSFMSSFGDDGMAKLDVNPDFFVAETIALQDDGSILVAGSKQFSQMFSNFDFIMARLSPSGQADTSFGTGGVLTFSQGSQDIVLSLFLLENGQILGTGYDGSDVLAFKLLSNSAELHIAKSSSSTEVKAGESINFSIEISNDGPDRAGAALSDVFTNTLTIDPDSITVSDGSCVLNETLECLVGITANSSTTVAYSGIVSAAGDITNTATITAQVDESDTSDNSASVTVTVTSAGGGCSLVR